MQTLDRDARLREIFLEGWRPYAWIILAGALLYFKALHFGFSYFDDQDLIVENRAFLGDIFNVFQAFCQKVYPKSLIIGYYRPILIASFVLNAQMGGIAPFAYHLMNVVIHLAVSCLVFALFARLGFAGGLSFFFALIFTVHPALTQAVAWVPGRNDSMLAAFVVASFIFFLRFLDSRRPADYLGHLAFLLLALFTKESALVLVVICCLYLVIVKGRDAARSNWKMLVAGQFAVCALWAIPRHLVLKGSEPNALIDMWNRTVPQLPAVVQLIGKAFFPVNQSVFPMMYDTSSAYGYAAIALLACCAIFLKKGSRRLILFGAFWAVLFLVPPLMRPYAPVTVEVLEHRLYLPVLGLMMMVMDLDIFKDPSARTKRSLVAAGVIILCAFSLKSFFYLDNFKDSLVFWESAARASPHSAYMHTKLGEIYYRQGRLEEGAKHMEEAIRLDPVSRFGAHYYLGHIYLKQGAPDKAEKEFLKTIVLGPGYEWSYASLGNLYYQQGRKGEACSLWKRCLAVNPENLEAIKNLAIYYAETGDRASARYYAGRLRKMGAQPPRDFLKSIGEE